ncbi:MAG: MFS transporter [Eubacteriaceae bacterium]|jgi:GPH family glycoside/pentoside/hexuronide:cation symporter|nr:MFS transporter [Eubacteriaceae bacterium]
MEQAVSVPKITSSQANKYGLYSFCQNLAIMAPYMYGQMFMADVLLVDMAWVTAALLVGRIVDFIVSLVAGAVIEKTHMKWGKYRSWLVIGRFAIFLGAVFQLTNSTAFPPAARLAICIAGYMMMHGTTSFTATSQYGLLALISGPSMENRVKLSVASSRWAAASSILASAVVLPLIGFLQGFMGPANAYMAAGTLFSALFLLGSGTILKLSAPYDNAQMWAPSPSASQVTVKDMISSVLTNGHLLVYILGATLAATGMAMYSAFAMYFFRNIFVNLQLYTISVISTALFTFVAAMVMPKLGKKLGKRKSLVLSYMWIAVGYTAMAIVLQFNPNLRLYVVIPLSSFVMCGIYFAMGFGANYVIDCSEYGYWKTGKDNRAVAMSMMSLPTKAGIAIGGAIGGYALAAIGYSGSIRANPERARLFLLSWFGFPAAFCLIASLLFLFAYKLKDEDAARYAAENAKRLSGEAQA